LAASSAATLPKAHSRPCRSSAGWARRRCRFLATLHTYSNLNHNTGYAQRSFSLSRYAGQTVTQKFTGSEDYELQTSFVIDDTAINVN
jgi:hypothetical protein